MERFNYQQLPLELRKKTLDILFETNAMPLNQQNDWLHNPEGVLARLVQLAWLKARNLVRINDDNGFPVWVGDEGHEFDETWFNDLNDDHLGINVQATWDYYDLDKIIDLVK